MTIEEQKGELIKKALTIVDELAKTDINDRNDIEDLIMRSSKLKKDRFWKLK